MSTKFKRQTQDIIGTAFPHAEQLKTLLFADDEVLISNIKTIHKMS
jgi:hypothetical protein